MASFTTDVAAIQPLSPSFDPDSYAVIDAIFDTLVSLDLDGRFLPGLATEWERLTPTSWRFKLRRGVTFHNGEVMDAHAVKFTYDYVMNPANNTGNAWILSSLKEVVVEDNYSVIIHTKFPDGLFLNRFHMFGSICPPGYIAEVGMEEFSRKPVGTGPFRWGRWKKGSYLELERNPNYWRPDMPRVDRVRFVILPEEQWLDAFLKDEVDFLPNLVGNQTSRLMREAKGQARILKRLVLSGYCALLKNQGALADVRVRKALNYGLNRENLVRFADYGNGIALASLGKKEEFGSNPNLRKYIFDPNLARKLLKEAGVPNPLVLKAIVADIAGPVARVMKYDFEQIGVQLNLEIVSRADWARMVVDHKIKNGSPPDYDVAINLVDNPIHNLSFHAGLFLHSESPWALLNHPEFDRKFLDALQTVDQEDHRKRLEALDAFIQDEALMVFLSQRVLTAAVKPNLDVNLALNGHLGFLVLSTARFK